MYVCVSTANEDKDVTGNIMINQSVVPIVHSIYEGVVRRRGCYVSALLLCFFWFLCHKLFILRGETCV